MLDIAPTELLLVALVALIVIGPKDLPRVMRVVGQWVGRARGVARHFRSGFDEMVRQAELDEMEKKWAAENERIMREHPQEPAHGSAADTDWTPQPYAGASAEDVEGVEAEDHGPHIGDRGAVNPAGGAVMTPLPAAPARPVPPPPGDESDRGPRA